MSNFDNNHSTSHETPKNNDGSQFKRKTPKKKPYNIEGAPKKISPKVHVYDIWKYEEYKPGAFAIPTGIYRDGLLKLINESGYWKRYRPDGYYDLIRENQNIIEVVSVAQIRDVVTRYVNSTAKDTRFDHAGITFDATAEKLHEIYLNNSPVLFNDAMLGHLPNHSRPILKDNKESAFFCFKNTVLVANKDGVTSTDYADLKDYCIWKDHIINHTCEYTEDGKKSQFFEFVWNVAGEQEDRYNAFVSGIGYLEHNHSTPSTARAVIAYDQEISNKYEPMGGTGKGILAQAVKQVRNVATIDGKKVKDDNQFSYQMVNERTQVIYFDDMKSSFDFLTFNSNLTEGWQIERKRKDAFRFAPGENPKTYISSNTILKNTEGTTAKRRQFVIEFAPYYSKLARNNQEPIKETHGNMFFMDDWNQAEWNRFFSFMADCAAYYIKNGLQFYELIGVDENKLIQQTNNDFVEFIRDKQPEVDKEFNLTEWATEFKEMYYGNDAEFSSRMFASFMGKYANISKYEIERRKSSGSVIAKFKEKGM